MPNPSSPAAAVFRVPSLFPSPLFTLLSLLQFTSSLAEAPHDLLQGLYTVCPCSFSDIKLSLVCQVRFIPALEHEHMAGSTVILSHRSCTGRETPKRSASFVTCWPQGTCVYHSGRPVPLPLPVVHVGSSTWAILSETNEKRGWEQCVSSAPNLDGSRTEAKGTSEESAEAWHSRSLLARRAGLPACWTPPSSIASCRLIRAAKWQQNTSGLAAQAQILEARRRHSARPPRACPTCRSGTTMDPPAAKLQVRRLFRVSLVLSS